jgi:hypothetical protein
MLVSLFLPFGIVFRIDLRLSAPPNQPVNLMLNYCHRRCSSPAERMKIGVATRV